MRSLNRVLAAPVMLVIALGSGPVASASVVELSRGEIVSVARHGWETSMSGDGRFVAYSAWDSSEVASDTNSAYDVLLRDTVAGTVEIASVGSDGILGAGWNHSPSVSDDGGVVAFVALGPDLSSRDTNRFPDVYVYDKESGATDLVSVDASGTAAAGRSLYPRVSADGRFVVYMSAASNIVANDTNSEGDYFVYDRVTKVSERVSVASDGSESEGSRGRGVDISADGRFVAFAYGASDLVEGDGNRSTDIFVRDRWAGVTERVSVSTGGHEADGASGNPSISPDGRFVVFESTATNLVDDDTNGASDVFVHDRKTGTTERVSVSDDGAEADGPSERPSISSDGRTVAFDSEASNLVSGDTNGWSDVFVRDRWERTTRRLSLSATGYEAYVPCGGAQLSDDGRLVLFESWANNLVSDDPEDRAGIYLRNTLAAERSVSEVAGATRYDTAIEVSEESYPDGADAVVVATGSNWPDALGGAALAGALEAPILLTPTNALPDSVALEIVRLGAGSAIILGGTGAVSSAVEDALGDLVGSDQVTRYAGATRYETAERVAEAVVASLGTDFDGAFFVATGANYPDALAAAPLSASLGHPILLVPSTGMRSSTASLMVESGADSVVILGGTGAVSQATEEALVEEYGEDSVRRLAGADRYSTAAQVASFGVDTGKMRFDGVGIATGMDFPDALVGGVRQGRARSVLLLTRGASLPASTADLLSEKRDWIGSACFLGGPGAVDADVRKEVSGLLDLDAPEPPAETEYVRIEESDPVISLSEGWTHTSGLDFSGGTAAYSDDSGQCYIQFEGSSFQLLATKGPICGLARVWLDKEMPVTVDLYSPTWSFSEVVYERPFIYAGWHDLRIQTLGTRSEDSAGTRVFVDAVDIPGEVRRAPGWPVRVENTDPRIVYEGVWESAAGADFSGGSLAYSEAGGAATIEYSGRYADLVALRGPNYGIARVLVDGVPVDTIDLYSPTWRYQQVFDDDSGLGSTDDATHTVRIEHTGTKNPASTGTRINIDAFTLIEAPADARIVTQEAVCWFNQRSLLAAADAYVADDPGRSHADLFGSSHIWADLLVPDYLPEAPRCPTAGGDYDLWFDQVACTDGSHAGFWP